MNECVHFCLIVIHVPLVLAALGGGRLQLTGGISDSSSGGDTVLASGHGDTEGGALMVEGGEAASGNGGKLHLLCIDS